LDCIDCEVGRSTFKLPEACPFGTWGINDKIGCTAHTVCGRSTGEPRVVAGDLIGGSTTAFTTGSAAGLATSFTGRISRQTVAGNSTTDTVCGIGCVLNVSFAASVTEDCAAVTVPVCGFANSSGLVRRASVAATVFTDNSCADCTGSTFAASITQDCIAHTVCGKTAIGGVVSRQISAGNVTTDTVCGDCCTTCH